MFSRLRGLRTKAAANVTLKETNRCLMIPEMSPDIYAVANLRLALLNLTRDANELSLNKCFPRVTWKESPSVLMFSFDPALHRFFGC